MGFGSFLGGLGSSIGRGASFLGNGIKSGVSKLGHLGQLGEAEGGAGGSLPQGLPNLGPGGTGGFAGNEGLPQISPSLINRRQSMPDAMPGLMPDDAPKLDPIRDSVNVSANLPPGQLPMPQHQGQLIPSRPVAGDSTPGVAPLVRQGTAPAFNPPTAMPGRDVDRSQVPIPQLPGHRGEPIPYNDIDAAKYDHVMSRMGHTDDGRHETGVKRDWKTSLQNMLMGANQGFQQTGNWAGALGGAGGALGGTLMNPQAGREYNFNNSPHLRGEMEGQRKEQQMGEDRALDRRMKTADAGYKEAHAEALRRPPSAQPEYGASSWGTYNKGTGQPGYVRPAGTPSAAKPQGLMNTKRGIYDPAERKWLEKFSSDESSPRPMTVSPGSTVIDPKTGREIYKAAPKETAMPREASQAQREVAQLKQSAMSLWNKAKNTADPAQKAQLEQQARDAQEEFSNQAYGLAEMYPEHFEAGDGEGGWAYFKPKGTSPTIQRKAAGQGGTAKLSDLKKLLQ